MIWCQFLTHPLFASLSLWYVHAISSRITSGCLCLRIRCFPLCTCDWGVFLQLHWWLPVTKEYYLVDPSNILLLLFRVSGSILAISLDMKDKFASGPWDRIYKASSLTLGLISSVSIVNDILSRGLIWPHILGISDMKRKVMMSFTCLL